MTEQKGVAVKFLDKSWNGKNKHSVYTRCNECNTFGICFPQDDRCGNCNSTDTMQYWDADTINSELADLKREWIPVSERLPENDNTVLIGWYAESVSGKRFWTEDCASYGFERKAFFGWRDYPEATHWMPLPPAPLDAIK